MKILNVKRETWPAVRLIGKKYSGGADWGEWWTNGWFDVLENTPGLLPCNGDGYTEAVHIVDGQPEYWVGMFFEVGADVPSPFTWVDIPALDYALCDLYGNSGELFTMEAHNQCLEAIKAQGLRRKEDDWCLKRCSCPNFTTPDEQGNVILDYFISIS